MNYSTILGRSLMTSTGSVVATHINDEDATRLWRVYESVSKNIERENALVAARISWAIFLTAGTVGAESFIASYAKDHYAQDPVNAWRAQAAILALSVLAGLFCLFSRLGVKAAQIQMEHIKEAYENKEHLLRDLGFPRPFGAPAGSMIGDYNAMVYPWALLGLWIVLFGLQLIKLFALWY
jgi:hypothetical protein